MSSVRARISEKGWAVLIGMVLVLGWSSPLILAAIALAISICAWRRSKATGRMPSVFAMISDLFVEDGED